MTWKMAEDPNIFVNFRTGYITEGHFVDDDRLAMLNYVKGAFVLDLLGSLPINVVIGGSSRSSMPQVIAMPTTMPMVNAMLPMLMPRTDQDSR